MLFLTVLACMDYNPRGRELHDYPPNQVEDLIPETRTDRIIQTVHPIVDVLFVIDNSTSMLDDQISLMTNLPSFFNYFDGSGVDYHIGVTTTDIDNPAVAGQFHAYMGTEWLNKDTPDAIDIFDGLVSVGVSGSGYEKGLGAAWELLVDHATTFAAGFRRLDASLNIIVISDEDDQTPDMLTNPAHFSDWMKTYYPDPDMRSFSSIVSMDDEYRGTRYLEMTHLVGGSSWDIHQSDWAVMLNSLGFEHTGLDKEFFLSGTPDFNYPVEVHVVTDVATMTLYQDQDWDYDQVRNSITFKNYLPPVDSEVDVSYTLL